MCIQTNVLLGLPLNNFYFYLFIFGATLLQYNLHYLFKITAVHNSRRLTWSQQNRNVHKLLIVLGCIFIIVSLFSFQLKHLIVLSVLGIISFLYSFALLPFTTKRIKDFGLLKIITLALLWTIITVWFPVSEINISGPSFQLIFLRRFIFIFVLCLLFDIRDIEIDRKANISTLAVLLGKERAYILCYSLLIVFASLSVVQFFITGNVVELIAMVISAIFTVITINISKQHIPDYVYLGFIDGMMLLQALLVSVGSIYFH